MAAVAPAGDYLLLQQSFGEGFEVFKSDVDNLEISYPLFKRKVQNWTGEDLTEERNGLRAQIARIVSAIEAFGPKMGGFSPEELEDLESYRMKFEEISTEFGELDREPAEAQTLLQSRNTCKKHIKAATLCCIVVVAIAAIVVLLHYKTQYV